MLKIVHCINPQLPVLLRYRNDNLMKNTLLLFLLLCAVTAFGQTSYWEELNAPPGGAPTKIIQTANGWVYAEFYDGAVFYSQDNGLNWQQMFWPSNDPDTGFTKITVGRAGTLFAERRTNDITFLPPYPYYDVYTQRKVVCEKPL